MRVLICGSKYFAQMMPDSNGLYCNGNEELQGMPTLDKLDLTGFYCDLNYSRYAGTIIFYCLRYDGMGKNIPVCYIFTTTVASGFCTSFLYTCCKFII